MDAVRITLVDHRTLVREGLKQLLNDGTFRIVGEAKDLDAACRLLEQDGFVTDLILFDFGSELDRPAEQDETRLAKLRTLCPAVRIIALSDGMCIERLTSAVNAGADGFLLKDISPSALRRSIELVMLGEKVFPTDLATWFARRVPSFGSGDRAPNGLAKGLSSREIDILGRLMLGHSNKVIANELNITEGTVKVHLKGVLKKINVRNRTQAAIWALNNGLPASTDRTRAWPPVPTRQTTSHL